MTVVNKLSVPGDGRVTSRRRGSIFGRWWAWEERGNPASAEISIASCDDACCCRQRGHRALFSMVVARKATSPSIATGDAGVIHRGGNRRR